MTGTAVRAHADLLDLTGRTALVTGGAMGIGAATAHRLSAAGANVVVVDVNGDAARAAAARLPGDADALALDVTDAGAAAAAVARCTERFGAVDILVNNAGIYPLETVLDATAATLDRTYAINVRACILFAQAAASSMVRAERGGRIINIASIEAYHPAAIGFAGYGATKGAIISFTKHLALELAPHGITVNAIAPGPVLTEGVGGLGGGTMGADHGARLVAGFVRRIPLGRLADPDDIATAALFFASGAAGYITGETLLVDGGNILS